MVETEALTLPTTVLRDQVEEMTGRLYTFLFSHIREVLITIILLIILFLIFKIRDILISKRSRKIKPESTNEWFSWEEFEKWKDMQKK